MEIDPVCGMEVDPKTAAYTSSYQGKTYYFCSAGCKQDFDKEPQKYMGGGEHAHGHGHGHGHMHAHGHEGEHGEHSEHDEHHEHHTHEH